MQVTGPTPPSENSPSKGNHPNAPHDFMRICFDSQLTESNTSLLATLRKRLSGGKAYKVTSNSADATTTSGTSEQVTEASPEISRRRDSSSAIANIEDSIELTTDDDRESSKPLKDSYEVTQAGVVPAVKLDEPGPLKVYENDPIVTSGQETHQIDVDMDASGRSQAYSFSRFVLL